MNLQEMFEKLTAALPGAEKAKQLEGRITELEAFGRTGAERITALEGQLAAKDQEIVTLKASVEAKDGEITKAKAEVEAKEADVEKRSNLKAAAILAEKGIKMPIADEGKANDPAAGDKGAETAHAKYQRLMSENPAEAAKFYAANAEAIIARK